MTVSSNVNQEPIKLGADFLELHQANLVPLTDRESLENTLANYLGGCTLDDLLEYLDGDLDNPFEQEILEDICYGKAKVKVSVAISYKD